MATGDYFFGTLRICNAPSTSLSPGACDGVWLAVRNIFFLHLSMIERSASSYCGLLPCFRKFDDWAVGFKLKPAAVTYAVDRLRGDDCGQRRSLSPLLL